MTTATNSPSWPLLDVDAMYENGWLDNCSEVKTMTTLEKLKADNGGTLPAFAWPGGYQMIYIASDGGVFCPDCANGKNGSNARLSNGPDDAPHDGWLLEAYDVFYEGPAEYCVHCNVEIESAYGDPNAADAE